MGFRSPARRVGRSGRRWLVVLAALLLIMAAPGLSYARALRAPGAATFGMRTVDWMRDHGAAPVVNAVENVYFTLKAPTDRPPSADSLPAMPPTAQSHTATGPDGGGGVPGGPSAALPLLPGRQPLPGEATWYPDAYHRTADGRQVPTLYRGWFQADAKHRSVVVGVAWIRARAVRAHLVAGITQPTDDPRRFARVPDGDKPRLLATFNSGWRLQDSRGGFYLRDQVALPLITGAATAAIDDHGRLSVGQWGRDLRAGPELVAARQNLHLIVDRGELAPGLDQNYAGQWGSPKNQYQFTGRSALGVDRGGNLIYVAGNGLTLHTLAAALRSAGAVRGMELDIHDGMQCFSTWSHDAGRSLTPTKLLPTMTPPADRYLQADQRDFFYLTTAN